MGGYKPDALRLREVFGKIVEGTYREWRNDQVGERRHGSKIDYLSTDAEFWAEWNKEGRTEIGEVRISKGMHRRELARRVGHIVMAAASSEEVISVEGKDASDRWREYVSASPERRAEMIEDAAQRKIQLGEAMTRGSADVSMTDARRQMIRVNAFLDWVEIHRQLVRLVEDGGPDAMAQLNKLLARKLRTFAGDSPAKAPLAVELHHAVRESAAAAGEEKVYQGVEIIDTDDPDLILRMGALRPDLSNCFNYHGNPKHNHTIMDVLGSKNKRLIIAKRGDEIMAVAVVKVRKGSDGRPILFLERGPSRVGYDFQAEMLGHLREKREKMKPRPRLATQILGKARAGDIQVWNTGSYADDEYSEALFGVRKEKGLHHRARLIEEDAVMTNVISYGTSNRTIEAFLEGMKEQGVRVVVDVRSRPQSQWFPHFNRKAFSASLEAAGIDYVWMGDLLGGYPEGYDGDFERYMREDLNGRFSRGIEELKKLAARHGRISIVCSEGNEANCHRRFIMQHLEY